MFLKSLTCVLLNMFLATSCVLIVWLVGEQIGLGPNFKMRLSDKDKIFWIKDVSKTIFQCLIIFGPNWVLLLEKQNCDIILSQSSHQRQNWSGSRKSSRDYSETTESHKQCCCFALSKRIERKKEDKLDNRGIFGSLRQKERLLGSLRPGRH